MSTPPFAVPPARTIVDSIGLMASPSALPLPISLVLLIHLHILGYPHANNTEYDQDMFNPRHRGLRERTKTMEDIGYFLVNRIEGHPESIRRILPIYPCLLPSDTTAFRTSLAKYLENLRHSSLRSNPDSVKKNSTSTVNASEEESAWWWKDVVVRKSLLEECSGERFERLLLSLSTHALFKSYPSSFRLPVGTVDSVQIQSTAYASLLSSAQSNRKTWDRAALLLLQRQNGIKSLRDRLIGGHVNKQSTYSSLSTDRQSALAESKLHDLSVEFWASTDGQQAIDLLLRLAGLEPTRSTESSDKAANSSASRHSRLTDSHSHETTEIPPQPLPIAAAHHPQNIRKLSVDLFASGSKKNKKAAFEKSSGNEAQSSAMSHASIIISSDLDEETRVNQALQNSLSRAKAENEKLNNGLRRLDRGACGAEARLSNLNLWTNNYDGQQHGLDLKKTPSAGLLSTFSLSCPASPDALERRIDEVRDTLLPVFPPPLSQQSRPRLSLSAPSRLPRPTIPTDSHVTPPTAAPLTTHNAVPRSTSNSISHVSPPQTPRQLLTSTPPQTVKPRSAYVRRVLATQRGQGGRKSIRTSLAVASRPSLFGGLHLDLDPDMEGEGEDTESEEVDRIVDAINDDSSIEVDGYLTPRPTATRLASRTPFSTAKTKTFTAPRASFKVDEGLDLPSFPSDLTSLDQHKYSSPRQGKRQEMWTDDGDDDEPYYEGVSVTLRDILLSAGDTTQFDLLGGNQVEMEDESGIWE
ncbi:hypothetical protein SERLA73DRAFT_162709 [Serpula lacrymans var. lacrymans S7.3]|uniref:HAUS augmin-like complex subunit 6 N-terminal domain-containing protein n=2 Tax=Serpula lacrymans var. lacrymans TaxID=341189 RepID=F8Q999_SERL3|nr:uncharacterized protein SERLADRAFT_442003 [Serpula lacrymans var. lacrymans S7.9]EGN95154.1 hypothetical protein SERLA73DRAFT_162709 [Serpula lacrymans var. lacrymans S7.3]EGO20666.1 hypothetical protein SERLADRAFT_442003 [Serpula lacrymans var. lacrymans S7.9]